MTTTQLIAPLHWDLEVLKQIAEQNKHYSGIKITSFYGALARGVVPHGRNATSVTDITKEDAIQFNQKLHKNGFSSIYLLNAPFAIDSLQKEKQVIEYLDWIVNKFKADAVTISSYELMQFVRQLYPKFPIYVSTIAGVNSVEDFKKYLDINPTRIVLHHDTNRNFNALKQIVKLANNLKIETEFMLTESCLRRCPNREAHYRFLGKPESEQIDKPFHLTCNSRKLIHPFELLLANVIRPEDIKYYEGMGISHFKLTGRSKPSKWLPEVTQAYLQRSYEGNLIRLLGIDPTLKAEQWLYIDNKSLDGFIEGFPKTNIPQEEIQYANDWIIKLWKSNNFRTEDDTKYEIAKDGLLTCVKVGAETGKFIKQI
jgi:collagenase-like PrtC family protease